MINYSKGLEEIKGNSGPDDRPAELLTEQDLRDAWDPELVEEIIDHQRHFYAPDGTRVWVQAEVLALSGAIEATKGAR